MSGSIEVKVIRRRSEVRTANTATAKSAVTSESPSQASAAECAEREKCRELLQSVISGLVDHPESISVSYMVGDRTTVFKVNCDQRCLGQIIGSKGKNISGVRAVIAATMARKGIRAVVEIPYYCLES